MSRVTGTDAQPADDILLSKPRLVHHSSIKEQYFRHRAWSVVQNTVSGQYVRIDSGLWLALSQLRGERVLSDWLQAHESVYGKVALLEAVAHLQRHGLLSGLPVTQGVRRVPAAASAFNPLMIKLPLLDPARLLDQLVRFSAPVSGRGALLSIVVLAVVAVLIATLNSERLMSDWQRVMSSPGHWWQYLLLYPCLKGLHETAHGLALRRLGGQVREAGISFLVLVPIPYVDATDAWSLERRRDRLLVTAAGMLSDIAMASIAMLAWFVLQPGVLTDIAFSIMLLSVVSVVVFNANPLLKFDGYYLLEDLIDSPGLARRSIAYWQYLFRRYLFLAKGVMRPVVAQGERRWLLPYGIASLAYRLVLSVMISLFLIRQLHEVGVVLSAFTIIPLFVRPLSGLLRYLTRSVQLEQARFKAFARLALLCLLLVVPLLVVPLPSSTRAEGIVWVPQQAQIYAREQGELIRWFVTNGEQVVAGQRLLQLASPQLMMELQRLESGIALLQLEHAALRRAAPELAVKRKVEIEQQQLAALRLKSRIDSLDVTAPHDGRIAFDHDNLLTGQRVEQGQLLMYLVDADEFVVRAVVDQRQLGKVENGVTSANIRLAGNITTPLPAMLSRQMPAGDNSLPSLALADSGFGGIDVEAGNDGARTVEQVFHLELTLDHVLNTQGLGGRAFITLRHPPETLARRWWRSTRQLFLKHLQA